MHQTIVLLGFFTVLLALIFKIFLSVLAPATAFLAATATSTVIVLGMYGVREGMPYDVHFDNLKMYGSVRARPRDSYYNSYIYDFQPYNDGQAYRLDGHSYGNIGNYTGDYSRP